MIKEREPILEKVSIGFQVLLSLGTLMFARWLTGTFIQPVGDSVEEYQILSIFVALLWTIILSQFGLGTNFRLKMYSTMLVEYFTALLLGNILLHTVILFLNFDDVSRMVLGVFAITNFVALALYKLMFYSAIKFMRKRGYNSRQVVILADDDSDSFLDRLINMPDWGYRIYAIMTNSEQIKEKYKKECTILPDNKNLSDVIDNASIDEVIYCKSIFDQNEIREFIYLCAEIGVIFRLQSQILSFVKMQSKLSYLSQMPFLTFRNTPDNYLALKMKLFFDFVFSFTLLALISPLLLGIAILVKLDGGPIFFKQKRLGLHGREFDCLKFRTMVVNAEALKETLMDQNEQEGPVFKMKNDPRVTRIGRFLRKTSLDELPQFINVLKGDMSVVGPRPPIPAEVKEYERWQSRRLSIKPGITCIWQVSGRNNIPFREWMKLDMQYIDNWSLKLDAIILIKTVKVVITGDGQ